MTRLAALLDNPDRLFAALRARAPELIFLPRAVATVGGVAKEIDLEATEALQLRIAALVAEDGITAVSRRDLRQTCRTFLHPPHAPAREPELAETICAEVDRLKRRAAFFALLDAYLDGFDATDERVVWLAKRLSASSKQWPWREVDPWPTRIKEFELLSPSKAPTKIAAAVMGSDLPYRSVFEAAGLNTDGRRLGGLGSASFSAACEAVRTMKPSLAVVAQDRLIDWSGTGGSLDYPKAWPEFAGALFEPWRTTEPPAHHKTRIVDRALGHAGDPRIQPGRWRPVKDAAGDAYAIIIRWLTQTSVRQFFDIVNETTDRPDMWAARRKFWTKYLDAGLIGEAWVAFGSDGARRADRAATNTNDKSLGMFGRLSSGGGRSPQHAALIMKMGDLTIVEWSHNGKWNIWRLGDKGHPTLFRYNTRRFPDYDAFELMNAPVSGPHMSGWQYRVEQEIRNHTGLRP